LSKQVKEFLQELASPIDVEDDFQLHVLKVSFDDAGEVEQSGSPQPVTKIEIDEESKECLLHYEQSASQPVTLLDVKNIFKDRLFDFEVCAAQEQETEEAFIRLDTPLIGFGENVELKIFFVICQAD